jgi:hypothetical protein
VCQEKGLKSGGVFGGKTTSNKASQMSVSPSQATSLFFSLHHREIAASLVSLSCDFLSFQSSLRFSIGILIVYLDLQPFFIYCIYVADNAKAS